MLSALRRLFAPSYSDLVTLTARIAALESEQLALVTEWVKTRDQVLRYMKRAGALRSRIAGQNGDEDDDLDGQVDLIRAKFGV